MLSNKILQFFGAIAGIRGHRIDNPIPPKGLPKYYSQELQNLISYEVIDEKKHS